MPRILELRGTETQVKSARDMIENILETEKGSNVERTNSSAVAADWNEESLSPQDSHWMTMNTGYRGSGSVKSGSMNDRDRERERRDSGHDSTSSQSHNNHNEAKDKDEYEALYGKFLLEDTSTPSSPIGKQAPPAFGLPPGLSSATTNSSTSYYKNLSPPSLSSSLVVTTSNNNNIDSLYEDSESSDDEFEDSTSLTRKVKITSQNLVPILQGKLGILDKVANCTGTTVRLVSKKEYSRSQGLGSPVLEESEPNSPSRGNGNGILQKRNALGSVSSDSNEMNSMQPVSNSRNATHVVIVSGLTVQEVISGVAVMKKVFLYLSTQGVGSGGYKAATALLIEHVVWPGDTVKDRTNSRISLLKDVGSTSGAGVVLIKKFATKNSSQNATKDSKILPPPVPIPPAPISFADAVCKREKEAAAALSIIPPPPINLLKEKEKEKEKEGKSSLYYNHHVVLIGSRFRIAAARTLLDKIMVDHTGTDDLSASNSSTSSDVSLKGSSGLGRLVHIPPPPRRSHEYDSGDSSSGEGDNSYSDNDDSYDSNSDDEGATNGKQWNRGDAFKQTNKNNERNLGRSERDNEKVSRRVERDSDRDKDDDDMNVVCILDCPNDKAGLVIGYKGSAIRTMSAKTRAKIVVTDATVTGGVSKRNVKIFGTRKQVDRAKALVERLMEIGTDALDEDYNPNTSKVKCEIL